MFNKEETDYSVRDMIDDPADGGAFETLSRISRYLERENARLFNDAPSMSEYVRSVERRKRRSHGKGRRR